MELVDFLKTYGNASSNVMLLVAVVYLWRDNVARQARYEAVLERCISALVRVHDLLDYEKDQ